MVDRGRFRTTPKGVEKRFATLACTATEPVWGSRSSTRHHQGRQYLSTKSSDRVCQPHTPDARERLVPSTVRPPSSCSRWQAGEEQSCRCRGTKTGCAPSLHLHHASAVHAPLSRSCLRRRHVHQLRRHRGPITACRRRPSTRPFRELASSTLLLNPNRHRAPGMEAHQECE